MKPSSYTALQLACHNISIKNFQKLSKDVDHLCAETGRECQGYYLNQVKVPLSFTKKIWEMMDRKDDPVLLSVLHYFDQFAPRDLDVTKERFCLYGLRMTAHCCRHFPAGSLSRERAYAHTARLLVSRLQYLHDAPGKTLSARIIAVWEETVRDMERYHKTVVRQINRDSLLFTSGHMDDQFVYSLRGDIGRILSLHATEEHWDAGERRHGREKMEQRLTSMRNVLEGLGFSRNRRETVGMRLAASNTECLDMIAWINPKNPLEYFADAYDEKLKVHATVCRMLRFGMTPDMLREKWDRDIVPLVKESEVLSNAGLVENGHFVSSLWCMLIRDALAEHAFGPKSDEKLRC